MKRNQKIRIPYALSVYGQKEISAVSNVLKNHKSILGKNTLYFEAQISKLFRKKYGIMTNSGSSANLIAVELLNLPKGSEVITPALTFSTTVAPILQKGLKPIFVDVELGTYVINPSLVEGFLTKNTKAFIIPSLIGSIPNLPFLHNIAKKEGIRLVEDSCDTIGATINGRPTGAYSDISTTSFYGSHIITAAGGGGMVCLNDEQLNKRARVLRGWGRSSAINETENIKDRYAARIDNFPYDSKFLYNEIGYNFLPLEISAAFGLIQLNRLKKFIELRAKNFNALMEFFSKYKDIFILPKQLDNAMAPWLAFPLTINENAKFDRLSIVTFLEQNNIQTRPIFSGNILKQPVFRRLSKIQIKKEFPNSDFIMKNGFLIGCHQGLGTQHITYIKEVFSRFLAKY
ncbi:MAG: DegT/DnrJ/EryC1/StrS family aminotransferase [Candidatus Micrarchaeaceae archaeon]